MAESLILSARDVEFLLYDWLDVEGLLERDRYRAHSRETIDGMLQLAQDLAERRFAPHNRKSDANEPRFDGDGVHLIPEIGDALQDFADAGFIGAVLDDDLGGFQLPHVANRACFAWFQAANAGTAGYPLLTMANARLLTTYGTPEQIETYVRPMVSGRFSGTMCLSESEAGSSLADVATLATPMADGTYRLRGAKMWISGGDHELTENIVHLVLARTPGAPAGVKGLSLFIVPKHLVTGSGERGERNDVQLAGLNHKMGNRGTTNTALNFGDGTFLPGGLPGAVGYLVGQEFRGLEYMFQMMNEARVAIGASAAALGYTGYLHALAYAKVRRQGRPLEHKEPSAPQVPIIRHTDVRRMLLASKAYAEGGLALVLYASRLLDDELTAPTEDARREARLLLDVVTPIAKSWPAQWCLAADAITIQVYGGSGYTRDQPVEQFYRDNRLNAIHEGTHGIQALDLLGRKVVIDGGAGFAVLIDRMRRTAASASPRFAALAAALFEAIDALESTTRRLWEDGDPAEALTNASVYLEACGHIVVAWIWLELAMAAGDRSDPFFEGKRAAARYFFGSELPHALVQLRELSLRDPLLREMEESWF